MAQFEFKVNGETLYLKQQIVDVADILRAAYQGKAIGEDPDKTGYQLSVPDSDETFVVGEKVDLEKNNIFRAAPVKGAPFA